MISAFLAAKPATPPATVDEAIAGLTTALGHLAAVKAEKRQEAADFAAQAATLTDMSKASEVEADRAERIETNIAALLA